MSLCCSSFNVHMWVHKKLKITDRIFNFTYEKSVPFSFEVTLEMGWCMFQV